jgi:hypothetical protein
MRVVPLDNQNWPSIVLYKVLSCPLPPSGCMSAAVGRFIFGGPFLFFSSLLPRKIQIFDILTPVLILLIFNFFPLAFL